MRTRKATAFVLGIAALYGALTFMGTAFTGVGPGSDYFAVALLAPFSAFGDGLWVRCAGLAVWVTVPVLIIMRRFRWCRIAAAAILTSHYFGVILMTLQRQDWNYVAQVWKIAWVVVVGMGITYLASQMFMWSLITRNMKTRPFMILTAVLGAIIWLPVLVIYLAIGPIHDFVGLRNTLYSSRFTVERYGQIQVGVPRGKVIDLLGTPLQTGTLTNYPVWALRDDGVRRRYGTNAELQIETLYFSQAKRSGDYDMVSVWVGPDNKVIQHTRWVTD